MKALGNILRAVTACSILFAVLFFSLATNSAPDKWTARNQVKFSKACGNGLDAGSACGNCVYVGGVAVTKCASCGHVCVRLPDGKSPDQMALTPRAAEDQTPPSFQPCNPVPGDCVVGWAHFEGQEWYADTHMMCGRFKNWSADRDRVFQVIVAEK
jgi:hypothetical protein